MCEPRLLAIQLIKNIKNCEQTTHLLNVAIQMLQMNLSEENVSPKF